MADVEMKPASPIKAEGTAEEAADDAPKNPPSETVYVHNLNEKVRPDVMKLTLTNLFQQFGRVLGVTAHRNVRMRGQAFVAMQSSEAAERAVLELKNFPLYGKAIRVDFAKTLSDVLIKRKMPEQYDEFLAERKLRKKQTHNNNHVRKKAIERKKTAKQAPAVPEEAPAAPAAAQAKKPVQALPDEYLPPNKILFIQNIPEGITKADLENWFKVYPNFGEVRTIPGRANIAFVEYDDEASSTVAREALHNYAPKGDDNRMRVTFAKS